MSKERDTCPYCNSVDIVYDYSSGLYVCSKCGSVLERAVFYGLETRSFEQTLPRTSGFYTNRVHDHGVGSTEFEIPVRNRSKWSVLSRVQKTTRTSKKERVVEKALRMLNQYSKLLETPRYVEETAALLLRKAVGNKNYKSETLRNLALASIYVASKIHGIPVSAKQYMKEFELDKSSFWRAFREISTVAHELNMKLELIQPESYVAYIVNKLGLPHDVEKLTCRIIDASRKAGVGLNLGISSVSLAAAAVYLSSILLSNRRKQPMFEVFGVLGNSLRLTYRKIASAIDIEVYM